MRRLLLLPALALILTPVSAAATWHRISGKVMGTAEQPSLYRTLDGVLHVVWVRRAGDPYDYLDTRIRPNGTIAGRTQILADWEFLNLPKVVRGPSDGMRIVFSGQRNTDSSDPFSTGAIYTTTGTESGMSWAAPNPNHSMSHDHLAGGPVGAAVESDGLVWAAWAGTGALRTHAGVDFDDNPSDVLDETWQDGLAYDPEVAVDAATGALVLGWFSLKDDQHGLYAQQITPGGPLRYVPNSASASKNQAIFQPLGRTEITGRTEAKPGVYMAYCAYPSCGTVRLWRFGASSSRAVGSGQMTGTEVAIAAGPNGRLWVLWMRQNTIWARRSNPSATTFGELVRIKAPGLIQYKLDAEGSRGPLDVFVTAADDDLDLALWHRRLQPGLTLRADPARFGNDRRHAVTFRVRDAGQPVGNATVRVAGRTLHTNANGNAGTTFPRGFREGRYTATATKAGYTRDTARIRVT
jgi:hypothetical protein